MLVDFVFTCEEAEEEATESVSRGIPSLDKIRVITSYYYTLKYLGEGVPIELRFDNAAALFP